VVVDSLADSDVGRHLMRMAAQDKPAFAVLKHTARTFSNIIIRNQSAVCSIHTSAPAVAADAQALHTLKPKERMPVIPLDTISSHHLQAGRINFSLLCNIFFGPDLSVGNMCTFFQSSPAGT
jgi:hypothetical protein